MFKKAISRKQIAITTLPLPLRVKAAGEHLVFGDTPRVLVTKVQSLRIDKAVQRFLTRLLGREHRSPELEQLARDAESGQEQPILRIHCAKLGGNWPELGDDEAYKIRIDSEGIELRAKTEWGICGGLELLAQLARPLSRGGWLVQRLSIEDKPAYPWRGLCLDVCRHWLGVAAIKRVLDGMAAARLNVLHLHLSDDQAFRLDIRGFPGSNYSLDGKRYSEEDILDIVNHAADRAIRVVPEIDIPGHCTALLAGHPTLGMNAFQPSGSFGGHEGSLDPAHEYTYIMLQELFTKMAAMFPDSFVHTGCDEVNTESWRQSDNVQEFMKQVDINNFSDLLAHFNKRVYRMLKGVGRSMIVWDEALHPRLPKDVVVQSWRSAAARDKALARKHRVIFSSGYYLDLFLAAKTHYRFDPGAPLPELLDAEEAWLESEDMQGLQVAVKSQRDKSGAPEADDARPTSTNKVLGGEACLWTELVDELNLDSRLFSRLPAIAERLWLGAAVDEDCEQSLYVRLGAHIRHLEANTELTPLSAVSKRLATIGLSPETITACLELLRWLEPVKWYRRLLGDDTIKAMLAGTAAKGERFYDVNTPLSRMVDMCAPESLARYELELLVQELARGLNEGTDTTATARSLSALAAEWQEPLKELKKSTSPLVIDVVKLAKRLHDCGELLLQWTDAATTGTMLPRTYRHYEEELRFMAAPVGELSLAVPTHLEALLNLCETREILKNTRPEASR